MKEDTNSGSAPQMESHAMVINDPAPPHHYHLPLFIIIMVIIAMIIMMIIITIITIMIIITSSISYLCKVVLRHLALNLPSAVCNKHSLVLISIVRF